MARAETSRTGNVADYLQCLFHGRLNFAMSPGLFYVKQQLFCGESLFKRIHLIYFTAVGEVKTGFKVKGILYGMQPQPGQPFLINHVIGVLA